MSADSARPLLVLFDIDQTLLDTAGAGLTAVDLAGKELYGPCFTTQGVATAGRLDSQIWADCVENSGLDGSDLDLDAFVDRYHQHLRAHPVDPQPCAGARELVDLLVRQPGLAIGLLTGNFRRTGLLKLARAGFDPNRFAVAVFADDGSQRRDLPAVAVSRFNQITGGDLCLADVVMVGDSEHDMDAATFNGCGAIGVLTGWSPARRLTAAGADIVVESLRDNAPILRFIAQQRESR